MGSDCNPLIVTLAVGQIVIGIASRYYSTVAIQKPVPPGLSEWTNGTFLGVTRLFWVGVASDRPPRQSSSGSPRWAAGSRWSAPTPSPRP